METITVPAEKWARLTSMYSGMLTDKQDGCCGRKPSCEPDPIRVKTGRVDGRTYTSFGMCHGGLEHSYIEAWELCHESEYPGPTHVLYHDQAAIDAGLRGRGDYEGLVVSWRGKRYVLTRPMKIHMSLPSIAAAATMTEAQAYDKESSRYGWRALWCKGSVPRWMTLSGFPAATYTETKGPAGTLTMLYYRQGQRIAELRVNDPGRYETIPLPARPRAATLRESVALATRLRSHHHNQHGVGI